MKRQSSSIASKTKWGRVRSVQERDVKLTAEHPEADLKHIVRGIARPGVRIRSDKRGGQLRTRE